MGKHTARASLESCWFHKESKMEKKKLNLSNVHALKP
jgi:hypothetical protein